jgi:hypothetical protein
MNHSTSSYSQTSRNTSSSATREYHSGDTSCPKKEQVSALAVLYAGLFTDLVRKIKLKLGAQMAPNEKDTWTIRLRTKDSNEIIVTTFKDYIFCAVQDCNPQKKVEKKEGEGEKAEEGAKS